MVLLVATWTLLRKTWKNHPLVSVIPNTPSVIRSYSMETVCSFLFEYFYFILNLDFNSKRNPELKSFPNLNSNFNFAGTRTTASEQSRVIFNVPVHVMNLESVMVDIKRDIAISLYIGDSKMWAGFQEFVIKAADDSVLNPDPVNPVVIADVSLLNTGTIYTGDGVTYRIKVTVPSGWSNFDIELEEAEG